MGTSGNPVPAEYKPLWTYGVLFLGLTVACAGLWLRCQSLRPYSSFI